MFFIIYYFIQYCHNRYIQYIEEERIKKIKIEENIKKKYIKNIRESAINGNIRKHTKKELVMFCRYTKIKMNMSKKKEFMIQKIIDHLAIKNERGIYTCHICFEDDISLKKIIPCHHTLCLECVLKLEICPFCRSSLKGILDS